MQEVIHAGEKNELLVQMEQEIRDPQTRALDTPGEKRTGPTATKEINGSIKIVLLRIAKIEHRTSQLGWERLFDARTRPFCVVRPSAGYRGE
jgi:hypothetical protein